MNAVTVHSKETRKPDFPAVVLTYTDALRALANAGGTLTLDTLAEQTQRVPSNLRRDAGKLGDAGVLTGDKDSWTITDKGRRWLLGQDVAQGAVDISANGSAPAQAPAGFIALTAYEITFDPGNARTHSGLSPLEIEEMAASVREHGILTPPIVRESAEDDNICDWQLVDGERRLRGWRLAIERGWIAADTRYLCQIFDGDDAAATEAALVVSLQRVDLDNLEAAEGLRKLSDKSDPPATAAAIAKRLGKEERWVEQRLKVAREATEDAKARYRAYIERQADPDHKGSSGQARGPDPDPFRWTDLRNSVQKPKHLTALEKNPALAMLVVELAHRADSETTLWDDLVDCGPWPHADIVEDASKLGLVRAFMQSSTGHPRLAATELALDWLDGQGFRDLSERARLLAAVRWAALGPVGAAALDIGEYGTPFLNPPPAGEVSPQATEGVPTEADQPARTIRPGLAGDSFSDLMRQAREAGDPSDQVRGGAEEPDGAPHAQPSSAPTPPQPDPASPAGGGVPLPPDRDAPNPIDSLPPLARLALLETALAIAEKPVSTRGGQIIGAAIDGFHSDPSGTWQALFMPKLVSIAQVPDGTGYLVVLNEAAKQALAANYPAGVTLDDVVAQRHAALDAGFMAGVAPINRFTTCWLSIHAKAAAAPTPNPSPAPPGEGGPRSGSDEGSTGGNQAPTPPTGDIIITGLRRALVQLVAAARKAQAKLQDLDDGEDNDLTATLAALSVGLEDAGPYLPKEQG